MNDRKPSPAHADAPQAAAAWASPAALLRDWQALTRRALDAARTGQIALALDLHRSALAAAQHLLAGTGEGVADDDRIAAIVVAHLNLADCLIDLGRIAAAVPHLCAPHRALLVIVRDDTVPATLQHAACRHLRETHAALMLHGAVHGVHPDITETLRAGALLMPRTGIAVH